MTTFTAQLATVLKTSEGNALKRATGLRILPACGRCGGSGQYSFNQIDGTRCYGCQGSGQRKPRKADEAEVLAEAERTIEDGRFDEYITYLRARKMSRHALDKMMAAWQATGISKQYDWRKAADDVKRDRDIADINRKMHDAYERVNKIAWLPRSTHPEFRDKVMALASALTEGLEEIAAADAELKTYLEENPA